MTNSDPFQYAANGYSKQLNLTFWFSRLLTIVLQTLMNVLSTMADANITVRTHLEIASVTAYLDMTSTMTANLVSVTCHVTYYNVNKKKRTRLVVVHEHKFDALIYRHL